MQSNSLAFPLSPLVLLNGIGNLSDEGFSVSRLIFFGSLLFSQGGAGDDAGMDFSKVGEKILSSISLLPQPSDRPQVPERAAAAAAVARILAGLPPHQRINLASSSAELNSIYGNEDQDQLVQELEDEFYEEDFDPVKHILEHLPSEETELEYLEEQASVRLAQLDKITERLSRHVMEHHEAMVKGMHLVRELEKDLNVANVICMNGRRHLTSSKNEVSRELIVTQNSKRKQALLDMIPVLSELRHAVVMQQALEQHVTEGDFSKAFQVLSEYLQVLDSLSELSVVQDMSHGVEVWLGKTLKKLDALLLEVCQDFQAQTYLTVVDAYALIGDVTGLAEKIQSFFMQEVLSESHLALKTIVYEDLENPDVQSSRLTYSDLCTKIPEPKFRQCLLATQAVIFQLMCSYHTIMSFEPEDKEVGDLLSASADRVPSPFYVEEPPATSGSMSDANNSNGSYVDNSVNETRDNGDAASSSGSPWLQLRKDATTFVSHALQRGRKNLWQLTTSRVAVLLSSAAADSTSIHQFLRNYDDLNIFILSGESFCGFEATEFRQKVKSICESYFIAFHRQSTHALKMVTEKENWLLMPPETIQVVSFAGLVGDGAALIVAHERNPQTRLLNTSKAVDAFGTGSRRSGFSEWLRNGNPFLQKLRSGSKEGSESLSNGSEMAAETGNLRGSQMECDGDDKNGTASVSEDENEDLLADFIDEDSQLPSRISKPKHSRERSPNFNDAEMRAQTGSSITLLRLMDKYARLMQKLEIVNVEFFRGIGQLFGIFFQFIFDTFGQPNEKGSTELLSYRLKTALSRASQDCTQWIKPQTASLTSSSPTSLHDVTPTGPPSHSPKASLGLKERCVGADTISLVAQLLHRSKAHLQSMLLRSNAAVVDDFYVHLVDAVPDLVEHIHRTTARSLLHINGYVDRIANAKWEVKELGMEHNGYVDLLLGEFKHYKTRLAHGEIRKEIQDLLIEYGIENVAEVLVEGLSKVKRCTDEGRALMSLDLQVLINGLKHFVSTNIRPKLHIVETFIKAYYLPETEYVHFARAHPEYTKSQIVGLINLVATMKGWKRKTRLEVLEKLE